MDPSKKSFFFVLILIFAFTGTLFAKNITTKKEDRYIIDLDADFWQHSESVQKTPKIVINALPIEPGDLLCFYDI